jgi:CTP:molybdopterin cytidylyltransferase MocA
MMTSHAALLLAAGGSSRLGTPKQLLSIEGEPLIRRAARAMLATRPGELYVVVGSRADEVFAAIADLPVLRIDCANWNEGLAASLRAGVSALPDRFDATLVALCDQPALTAEHLAMLVTRFAGSSGTAVASTYAGVVGVPAVLPRAWFAELLALRGDTGARDLLRNSALQVETIEAPDLAHDIDEPSDRNNIAP